MKTVVGNSWQISRRSLFTLAVVSGTLLTPLSVEISNAATPSAELLTQKTVSSATSLRIEDLPAGFEEIPSAFKPQIAAYLSDFVPLLTKQNLQINDYFVYVNRDTLEVVSGFTTTIPNQPLSLLRFDANLRQVAQPQYWQQLFTKLQPQISVAAKLLEHRPNRLNVGNSSAGATLAIGALNQKAQVDVGSFRRGNVGVFTAVMSLNRSTPQASLQDLATKLDNRIVQATANSRGQRSEVRVRN
ncbi:hypothetical protein [Chroogloeocystis siderophila]|uniref:Uncharacterized protein n=1 Tax=Chroogloeocystis siderophila 5.2 s.c.1 TaxID=247279 RepID=A0A1U7HNB9_9CHRO|nr:hypothetical protein [Chroogloeocystis siderophila]OKH25092.1 hypothetical protein NIES1031_14720 [Chroogloeocystis siderophila 5.2 s.c.1]